MERKEVNILDYFYLLYKGRKFILLNFIVLTACAVVASLMMPNMYRATTTMLPPKEARKGFGFAEQLASQVTTLRLGTQGSPSDLYIGIIKSNVMLMTLVDKFNLVSRYGVKDRDAAVGLLKSATDVTITKEGLIKLDYEDRNPEQAATICNMYVTMLDSLNQSISQRASRERADFIEQMLNENDLALKEAEMELKQFQFETKAVSPYQQQRVALSVTAELEMDIMNKENELREMRSKSFTDSNPLVQDLMKKIRFREEQLHNMRFGGPRGSRETLFVPLQEAPSLTIQYEKLSRRVEALGMLEHLLRNQYEESRIEQVNTTSTVSILDRARPPIGHSKPKRSLIVLVTSAASLFFSIIAIITLEYVNHIIAVSPENREKVARLSRFLRIDN
ncbi:MAG: GumC family protein [Candidatus Latescibacterota bacterium]